jgi:hypothetical protein
MPCRILVKLGTTILNLWGNNWCIDIINAFPHRSNAFIFLQILLVHFYRGDGFLDDHNLIKIVKAVFREIRMFYKPVVDNLNTKYE